MANNSTAKQSQTMMIYKNFLTYKHTSSNYKEIKNSTFSISHQFGTLVIIAKALNKLRWLTMNLRKNHFVFKNSILLSNGWLHLCEASEKWSYPNTVYLAKFSQ